MLEVLLLPTKLVLAFLVMLLGNAELAAGVELRCHPVDLLVSVSLLLGLLNRKVLPVQRLRPLVAGLEDRVVDGHVEVVWRSAELALSMHLLSLKLLLHLHLLLGMLLLLLVCEVLVEVLIELLLLSHRLAELRLLELLLGVELGLLVEEGLLLMLLLGPLRHGHLLREGLLGHRLCWLDLRRLEALALGVEVDRVDLTNCVERLLSISKDDLSSLLEASYLDFDYLSNAFLVVLDISDALVVLDDPRDTEVEAAEHDPLLDVLDEGQNICVYLESIDVDDVSVDEAVSNAFAGVCQNLMVQLGRALVDLASLGDVVNDFLVEHVHLAHLLVDLRQVFHVLGCVLDHRGSQGPCLPERLIVLHG